MQPEMEQKTIQSAGWDSIPPHSCDSAISGRKNAQSCRKGAFAKKMQRWKQHLHTEWVDTFGAGKCEQVTHNVCWEGHHFPCGHSLKHTVTQQKQKIDECSYHVIVKNSPNIRLDVEQDKLGAIFWKQPLETNKTFWERELMSTALSPSFLIASDVCVCIVRRGHERDSGNRLWLLETMAYAPVLEIGYQLQLGCPES